MAFKNPYRRDTQKHRILDVLRDLRWHCSECELPGSQPAKALQGLRQDGFELEKVKGNWAKTMACKHCKRKTPHRRLITLRKTRKPIKRTPLNPNVRERIIRYYKNSDEIFGYSPTGRKIEIDHRIPEIRWGASEKPLPDMISQKTIEEKFMLLTKESNSLKSRHCEKCKRTGIRQPFLGMPFFYRGNKIYKKNLGCVGCGWHNPKVWREKIIKRLQMR